MSLATRVYARSPVWLQNAALSTYGLLLRSRRYGGIYGRTLDELTASQRKSADELATYQLGRLNHILNATHRVPLYVERGDSHEPLADLSELSRFPTVSKSDFRQPRERIVSVPLGTKLLEIHTGGTTGTPLSVYCNRTALQRNYAFFERYRRWAGFRTGARTATFAGRAIIPTEQSGPPFWRRNAAANTVLFSSYHIGAASLPHYVRALEEFQPEFIDSYPSNLELIARYMLEHEITTIHPRGIITSSETLFPQTRSAIEQAFGCRVFDHYGGAEMAALITQCEHGTYHVNPEFGIVEILRDGKPVPTGQMGEIVATGFVNDVMPLIRYATGDLGAMSGETCACGRAFPTMARIEGRMDDFLITPEGFSVGRLDPIFKAGGAILETRIVQDEIDHARIELVPAAGYTDADGQVLVDELRKRVGTSMRIDIVQVAAIPRTKRGKLRMVVNEVAGRSVGERT